MKILITGANGDVGKSLMEFLLEKGYDVLGMVRKDMGKNYVQGNLRNIESLISATKNIDIVIHLAALIRGSKKQLQEVNVEGTKNLIRACEKNNVKKIISFSSLDIKFDLEYGKSKLASEELIRKSKLSYVILRPSLIYGENFEKGISSLIKIIKKLPIIPVIGRGKNLYQPLYVGDLNKLIKQIIEKNKFEKKEYFVCGKEEIDMNYLIDLISSKLEKKKIKFHIPIFVLKIFKNFGLNYKNFIFDKIESNNSIQKDFEFNPIGINQGIEKLI